MRVIDVVTSPWAILPEKLLEIRAIYETHLRGEKIDIAGIEARLGRPLANEPAPYQIVDNVAIITLEGVIAKRLNLFSKMSGGVSSQLVSRDIKQALADDDVRAIILVTDSPGGTVDGTQELAQLVRSANKPIVTWSDGTIASAAYWIGSAANQVFVSGGTVQVGSIGVVATHVDMSRAEEAAGVKTTEVVAGRYKRIASQHAPLSEEGRKSIQDSVDYLYSIFVADVATHRGVSVDTVLENMADGRVFLGTQAIDAGLVDGVSTLDDLIAKLSAGNGKIHSAGVAQTSTGDITMEITAEMIQAEHPQIADAFRAEGARAERERIQGVEAQSMRGHEALINALKFDGKTSSSEAAVQVLAAEKARLASMAANIQSDAPAPAAPSTDAQDPPAAPEKSPEQVTAAARQIVKQAKDNGIVMSITEAVACAMKGESNV